MNGALPIMNDQTLGRSADPRTAIVMRFATLGGATVIVTDHPDRADGPYRNRWECLGCLAGSPPHRADLLSLKDARDKADTHAGGCRSLPPAQPSRDDISWVPMVQTRRGEDLR
jgi:hypothetical protein